MKHTGTAMASALALGLFAGTAVGVAGMYRYAKHPQQVRKALHNAGKEAEKAMMTVEKALR